MLERIAVVLGILTVLVLGPGCATPPDAEPEEASPAKRPLVVRDDVVATKEDVSDEAIVSASEIRFPKSMKGKLADVEVGSVITGLPSEKKDGKNPDGFLRRVTRIETKGSEIVLTTEPASLKDLFQDGTLDLTLVGKGAPRKARSGIKTQTLGADLEATFEQSIPSFGFDLSEVMPKGAGGAPQASGSIKVESGKLTIKPFVHIKTDFSPFAIDSFSADVGLDYEAVANISAQATLKVARPIQLNGKTELTKDIIPERDLVVGVTPTVPPIPYSIKAGVVASCRWQSAAAVKVTATTTISGHPHVKIVYDAKGGWSYEGNPIDVKVDGDTTMGIEGQLDVTCSVSPKIGLYFFGVAGPYVAGGPSMTLTAKSGTDCPPPGASLTLTPGFNVKFGAAVQIFGLAAADTKLWEENLLGDPILEVGKACGAKGVAEPCAGKESGYYCGATISGDPALLYYCAEGKTTGFGACPNTCDTHGNIEGTDVMCL